MKRVSATLFLLLVVTHVYAATPVQKPAPQPSIPQDSPQLQACLKRADDYPDIASAEAGAWIKKGGGNDAHLCRAFAQSNRGMHADSAREFWYLADIFAKKDPYQSTKMHDFAGREFLAAKDQVNAISQYELALKTMPGDADGLIGHANALLVRDKYWDALADLNKVLAVNADNIQALRLRGRVWLGLANSEKAQEDFEHAAALDGSPQ